MDKSKDQLADIPVSPRQIGFGIVVALLGYIAYSSYYTVSAESVGVVQRIGHYHEVDWDDQWNEY